MLFVYIQITNYWIAHAQLVTLRQHRQLIEDMFQDEPSREQLEQPPQECSLNYTVTSRSSKHHKREPSEPRTEHRPNDSFNILTLASSQLGKFNQWLADSELKFEHDISTISTLVSDLETTHIQSITFEDLSIIKNQLFKKQNDQLRPGACKQCEHFRLKVQQLEGALRVNEETIAKYCQQREDMRVRWEVGETKEQLLGGVEVNLLQAEIGQLKSQILTLQNQKSSLEKTCLFNKTRNSELQMRAELQRSKGLSGGKNSTNSSELTGRNQETIVFIDPVESDVQEWVRFFQIQKNRYMAMCKKEEGQRIKALGRNFTKEERCQLHSEGRIFVIFSSIKDIWKNLIRIRDHTRAFLAVESSKGTLRERLIPANDSMNSTLLKQQNDKLNAKLIKTAKLNEYLLCEKSNLSEVNEGLRRELQRLRKAQHRVQQDLESALRQLEAQQVRSYQFDRSDRREVLSRFK